MVNIFLGIDYLIMLIVMVRMGYYLKRATIDEDGFGLLGFFINGLLLPIIAASMKYVSENPNPLIHIIFILIELIGCIYFGFFYVNKAEKDWNKDFDLNYAKSFLESYGIDVNSFKEKSYEEQLEIINSAYIMNCDSGMVEYMIDKEDEDDLKDILDILEPLLNKG